MKKIISYSILVLAVFFVSACRKSDNPKLPELTRFPLPTLTVDASTSKIISPSTASTYNGKITVDVYFKNDVPPKQYDLVVQKNGGAVKVLQAGISTFPTTVSFTGTQLATLFGEPIKTCDYFDFGVNVTTQAGDTYEAFPTTGKSYASGVVAQPGATPTQKFTTKVEFNAADFNGNFVVVEDEWADYKAGDIVPLTLVSPTEVSFKYAVDPGTAQPIVMKVDPNTLAVSVAKQYYGSYGGSQVYAQSVSGAASVASPCDKTISVRLQHSSPSGTDYGSYTIKFKKQ